MNTANPQQPRPADPGDSPCCNLHALVARRPRGNGRGARAHDRLVAGLAALAADPSPVAVDETLIWQRLAARQRAETDARRRRREAAARRLRVSDVFCGVNGSSGFALPAATAFLATWLLATSAGAPQLAGDGATAPATVMAPSRAAETPGPAALRAAFRSRDQHALSSRDEPERGALL